MLSLFRLLIFGVFSYKSRNLVVFVKLIKSIAQLAVHFPTLVKEAELDDLEEERQDLLHAKAGLQTLNQSSTSFWQELLEVKGWVQQAKIFQPCHSHA